MLRRLSWREVTLNRQVAIELADAALDDLPGAPESALIIADALDADRSIRNEGFVEAVRSRDDQHLARWRHALATIRATHAAELLDRAIAMWRDSAWTVANAETPRWAEVDDAVYHALFDYVVAQHSPWYDEAAQSLLDEYSMLDGTPLRDRLQPQRCLEEMVARGHPAAVRDALRAGGDARARTVMGREPIHGARTPAVIDVLLAAGADLEARDELGRTPLLTSQRAETLEKLLACGARIDAVDDAGRGVLHFAHDRSALDLLVAAGASLDLRDHRGRTPLEHARDQLRTTGYVAYATWVDDLEAIVRTINADAN